MKKYVLLTAMVVALVAPSMAWSQNSPGAGGAPPSGSGYPGGGPGDGQRFQEHKAEMLKHLNERLTEIQKRIGCVQAASNHEALHACMPERGEGPGGAGR